MKFRETAFAAGLSMSLMLGACGESQPAEYVDETVLEEHNEALRERRQEAFETLSQEFYESLEDAQQSRLRDVLELTEPGFVYAEPGNYLADPKDTKDERIKLVSFFPEDEALGYSSIEKFAERGAAAYFGNTNTVFVGVDYPLELQVNNLIHELTHGLQEKRGIVDLACEVREPEALRIQSMALPYTHNPETVEILRNFSEQIVFENDGINYGDVSEVQALSDEYSEDEKVRSMFTLIARYFATHEAMVREYGAAAAVPMFEQFVAIDYCANPPA